MPVPKRQEKVYGKIIGHLINLGYSHSEAKKKTDKAIADHPELGTKAKKKKKSKK